MKVNIAESANCMSELSADFISVSFTPAIKTLGKMQKRSIPEIKNEPMFFNSSPRFVLQNCGDVTRDFFAQLIDVDFFRDSEDLKWVFDSRVTMTMPGMYPSIPGWHCDDFRRGHVHAQPDIERGEIDDSITHYMGIVGDTDELTGTEFVTQSVTIEIDKRRVWNSLDAAINFMSGDLKTRRLQNQEIIRFNQSAIHRATEATKQCWRWWGRLSYTYRKPVNEIRRQVQVYVSSHGW